MITGILLTFGTALIDAIGFVSLKRGLETVDYKVFIILSLLIGVALSGLLLWIVGPGMSGLSFSKIWPFLITGSFGGGLLARISMTMATHQIGASVSHAVLSVSPLITALIGVFFLGELVTLQLGLGGTIVIGGAALLSYLSYSNKPSYPNKERHRPLLGLGFAFYATVLVGIQPVLQKLGLELGVKPLQGVLIRFGTALVLYVAYLAITRPELNITDGDQTGYFFLAGIAWGLFPLLSLFALTYIPATVFSILIRVGPLFTAIFSYYFLKGIEEMNLKIGLGAFITVIGAVVVLTA